MCGVELVDGTGGADNGVRTVRSPRRLGREVAGGGTSVGGIAMGLRLRVRAGGSETCGGQWDSIGRDGGGDLPGAPVVSRGGKATRTGRQLPIRFAGSY